MLILAAVLWVLDMISPSSPTLTLPVGNKTHLRPKGVSPVIYIYLQEQICKIHKWLNVILNTTSKVDIKHSETNTTEALPTFSIHGPHELVGL